MTHQLREMTRFYRFCLVYFTGEAKHNGTTSIMTLGHKESLDCALVGPKVCKWYHSKFRYALAPDEEITRIMSAAARRGMIP